MAQLGALRAKHSSYAGVTAGQKTNVHPRTQGALTHTGIPAPWRTDGPLARSDLAAEAKQAAGPRPRG